MILEDNGYRAKMLCDSISPDGVRLSTMEVTFPRIVLAEFNTHRTKSRNSASSRAIPVEKQLKKVKENPFVPSYWGKNQKGMQAEQELSISEQEDAIREWLDARDDMVRHAQRLLEIGVHKQITNRLLEPFMWHTVIVSATEWGNFFALRCHKDAQPEIRRAAILMKELHKTSKPRELGYRTWHLPLIQENEIQDWVSANTGKTYDEIVDFWKRVSVGRCARVSYLTHDGKRDLDADLRLCETLRASGHMSPFEHVARPMNHKEGTPTQTFVGNFRGWIQYRKELPNENDYGLIDQKG